MVKLSRVLKVEVGGPGAFAKLGKQGILEKLEEKGGPEARQLFEKFMRDVEKLQAQRRFQLGCAPNSSVNMPVRDGSRARHRRPSRKKTHAARIANANG